MLSYLRTFVSRIRATFQHANTDRELGAEVQSHLEMLAQRFRSQGMCEEEARCAARRQFGGVTQLKADLHQRRGLPQLAPVCRAACYALPHLGPPPGLPARAPSTLAL